MCSRWINFPNTVYKKNNILLFSSNTARLHKLLRLSTPPKETHGQRQSLELFTVRSFVHPVSQTLPCLLQQCQVLTFHRALLSWNVNTLALLGLWVYFTLFILKPPNPTATGATKSSKTKPNQKQTDRCPHPKRHTLVFNNTESAPKQFQMLSFLFISSYCSLVFFFLPFSCIFTPLVNGLVCRPSTTTLSPAVVFFRPWRAKW